MAIFEFLRISLAAKADLFADLTRQQFLRQAFSRRWDFTYRKRLYTYTPLPRMMDDIVGGIVGREISEFHNDGPDTHWSIIEQKHWPIAYLALDIGEREQIAAFQNHNRVGSPLGLLESLLEHIARDPSYLGWRPSVEYMASKSDFWKAAETFKGKISALTFTFVPPNMLGAKQAIDNLVKAASAETNAEETELKLRNPGGNLVPAGDLVEASLDTATSGGGEVTMKAGKKTVFSSSKNRTTKEFDADDIPKPSSIEQVLALFKRLLPK